MSATIALDAPSWLHRSCIVATVTSARASHRNHNFQMDYGVGVFLTSIWRAMARKRLLRMPVDTESRFASRWAVEFNALHYYMDEAPCRASPRKLNPEHMDQLSTGKKVYGVPRAWMPMRFRQDKPGWTDLSLARGC